MLGITEPYEAMAETNVTEMAAEETDFAAEKHQDIGPGYDIAAESDPEVQAGVELVEEVEGSTEADLMEYIGIFILTVYCSCRRCCGKWSGEPTASGVMPAAGRGREGDRHVQSN